MNKTVLFVSGNKTLVMFMGILVKRMGFEVISARNGQEAAEIVGAVQPAVVMIDSEMAEFDGLHKLDCIKDVTKITLPIIMLVGSITDEAIKNCIRAGVSTVLFKPVIPEELQNALQECLFDSTGIRRKHVRAKASLRVTVFYEGRELSLQTESLSVGGAFIRHVEPLNVGTVVDMFMPVGDQECLFVTGKVIYNQKPCQGTITGLCPGFAVKFLELGEREAESIREFVLTLLTEDIEGLLDGVEPGRGNIGAAQDRRSAAEIYSAIHSYAGKPVMRR